MRNRLRSRTLFFASAAVLASISTAAFAEEHQFSIKPTDLSSALKLFGRQSGEAILFQQELTGAAKSPGAVGKLEPKQALEQILSGSNFEFRKVEHGFVVVPMGGDMPRLIKIQSGGNLAPMEAIPARPAAEVVVTANKRLENVQDVPKQVQVVGGDALKQTNVTTVTDLRKLVPSISGTGNSIRGVATSATTISANSKVGIVLDDIPIPTRAGFVNNLLDIEQVEVLPGPQGTLAGRNATGGLINLVTRKPTMSGPMTGLAQGTVTSDRERIWGGYISGPIIEDKLGFSLSANNQYFRGLKYNLRNGQWASNANTAVRGKLRWTPDAQTDITATYMHYEEEIYGNGFPVPAPFSYVGVPITSLTSTLDVRNPKRNWEDLFPGLAAQVGPRSEAYYSAFEGQTWRNDDQFILRAERNLGALGDFTAIGSVLHERSPVLQDTNNYTLVDMNIRPEYDGYAHVWNATTYKTLEARLASPTDQPWTYLVGAFWSDNTNIYDYTRLYQPVNWHRSFGQSNWAAFGSTSYTFPTQTTIRAGVRYEDDDIDYLWHFYPILAVSKTSENGTVLNFPVSNQDRISTSSAGKDYVNYDVGIQQKFGEDVMAYFTYGVADQGPIYDAEDNTVAIVRDLTPVPSENVKAFELGLKSQWFDHRLTFNINAFHSTYHNYQASTNVPDPENPNSVPVLKLNSVGEVVSKGVELTSTANFDNGFRLSVAGIYNEATISDWINTPCYPLQSAFWGCITGVPPGEKVSRPYQVSLSGHQLASAPKWKFTIIPSYEFDTGIWDTRVRAMGIIRYASEQNTNLLGDPAKYLPNTTYVDANLSFIRGNTELQFFVNNLFEEFAETFGYQTQPGLVNFPRGTDGVYNIKTRDLDRQNNRYVGVTLKTRF